MLRYLFILLIFLIGVGCSNSHKFVIHHSPPNDQHSVPSPEERDINLAADNVNKLATEPTKQIFDLSNHFRKLFGSPKQAMNVDPFDEVYNSSWFTNRNAQQQLSLQEIAKGPDTGTGPDTSGIWTIFRAKAEGVTPGFSISDSRGDRYVIKFDSKNYSEMAIGAELVSTKLFYAAGYNVPENYLCFFNPENLRLGNEVKFTDERGQKRFMNEDDLKKILNRIQKRPDGLILAVASKYLPGKPLGPFRYMGVRKDDANDVIPHQHRRELRGLRVIAAWLNHYDTKANNSLDIFVEDEYVKHYLIDFGSTLGSQGDEPMPPEIGREGPGDPGQVIKLITSLGSYIRPWETDPEIPYSSIGYFEANNFHPLKYKYILPNPAFINATNLDCYWGAKLVMSFTDEQIRAAVEQGQYSNPDAEEYLIKTLIERRNIVGRFFFDRIPPLDDFEIRNTLDNEQELHFKDLVIKTGLESAENTKYIYRIYKDGKVLIKFKRLGNSTKIPLPKSLVDKDLKDVQLEVELRLKRNEDKEWSKRVKVYIQYDERLQDFVLLGIKREN